MTTESAIIAVEKSVKTEFGKPFDAAMGEARRPEVLRDFSRFDWNGKIGLDVGSGHPTVPAIITAAHPTARFDCVDLSPDFEAQATDCVTRLRGDMSRIRCVTADFYDIANLAEAGKLERRYDYVLLMEALHHSLRKAKLLQVLTRVMDENSRMILVEPVLPVVNRAKAYAESQWARDLGYIEDPVGMRDYLAAFREAGLEVESVDYERSREFGLKSWKRRLIPTPFYDVYRRRIRPLWAQTTFTFVCRLRAGSGRPR
ncbi:MAG: class I SAM-dependent methyltransferase [Deltaproteobacteria bacterium]|nr:class I SAM-dependent methyltransferase [Deltaproteobacteria bacterium]